MTTKTIGFSFREELIEQLDKARGDVSRSRYVARILERHLNLKPESKNK